MEKFFNDLIELNIQFLKSKAKLDEIFSGITTLPLDSKNNFVSEIFGPNENKFLEIFENIKQDLKKSINENENSRINKIIHKFKLNLIEILSRLIMKTKQKANMNLTENNDGTEDDLKDYESSQILKSAEEIRELENQIFFHRNMKKKELAVKNENKNDSKTIYNINLNCSFEPASKKCDAALEKNQQVNFEFDSVDNIPIDNKKQKFDYLKINNDEKNDLRTQTQEIIQKAYYSLRNNNYIELKEQDSTSKINNLLEENKLLFNEYAYFKNKLESKLKTSNLKVKENITSTSKKDENENKHQIQDNNIDSIISIFNVLTNDKNFIHKKKDIKFESENEENLELNKITDPELNNMNKLLLDLGKILKTNINFNYNDLDLINAHLKKYHPTVKKQNNKRLHIKEFSQGKKICRYSFRKDCIRKRIKTFFNNYILNKLNLIVKDIKDLYFLKLPKDLIVNLRINLNQEINEGSISELFSRYVDDPQENKKVNHNIQTIQKIKKLNIATINNFLNEKVKDVYNEYFASEEFAKDVNTISKKDGQYYSESYSLIASTFLDSFKLIK